MSEKKCFECKKETAELFRVPTGSGTTRIVKVKPRGRDRFATANYFIWNELCYGCFVAYSGFDNEGRPAVVQLFEPQI